MHSLLTSSTTALTPSPSYATFWDWFSQHETAFFHAVKTQTNIEEAFFDLLSTELDTIKEGFCFLTSMLNPTTAELVISAEGAIENIVLVEELIQAAPVLAGWKFTALKSATDMQNLTLTMGEYQFTPKTLTFYRDEDVANPDKINLTVMHPKLTKKNAFVIQRGVRIFLDNHMGELAFATIIDRITVTGSLSAQRESIPFEKVSDYLLQRQKKYIEKYEGRRHSTAGNILTSYLAKSANGKPLFAVVNTGLLVWEDKPSHPWILVVVVKYNGTQYHGLPDEKTQELLNQLDADIQAALPEDKGHLNIARLTVEGRREIYFACHDFREPSKVLYHLQASYAGILNVVYEINKDKYWDSLPASIFELSQSIPSAL